MLSIYVLPKWNKYYLKNSEYTDKFCVKYPEIGGEAMG
jgi:hypothetical protein